MYSEKEPHPLATSMLASSSLMNAAVLLLAMCSPQCVSHPGYNSAHRNGDRPAGLNSFCAAHVAAGSLHPSPTVRTSPPDSEPRDMNPASPPSVVKSSTSLPRAWRASPTRWCMYWRSVALVLTFPYEPYSFSTWTMITGPPASKSSGFTSARRRGQ
eukprot:1624774-Prymnesium_polylepis.1